MQKRHINPPKKIDLVIRAARKLFVEKGFRGVAIPEIVKESGVSVGAIYLHFDNKEKLAQTVYQYTLDQFTEQFSECLAGRETAQDKLSAFAELVFELTEEDPDMMEFMLSACKEIRSHLIIPLCTSDAFTEVQQIVKRGITSGDIKAGNYFLTAISYTGVILRAADLRLQGIIEQPLHDISAELIDNAWSSISAAPLPS
ncbi:MAG: TetR/AcrR family transcriptional regulator [Desulfuromusa sp.]|jgi:AcrR family transcriptional regulator|nr:TetR/AcrR family transcriptional regulator [Desulfuromusa sp.]